MELDIIMIELRFSGLKIKRSTVETEDPGPYPQRRFR